MPDSFFRRRVQSDKSRAFRSTSFGKTKNFSRLASSVFLGMYRALAAACCLSFWVYESTHCEEIPTQAVSKSQYLPEPDWLKQNGGSAPDWIPHQAVLHVAFGGKNFEGFGLGIAIAGRGVEAACASVVGQPTRC